MSSTRVLRQLSSASSRAIFSRAAASSRSRLPIVTRQVACRTFSVSARSLGQGANDVQLSEKLSEELKYEQETANASTAEFLQDFKKKGIWEIEEEPFNDEVTLTRKFGNENLRLTFSIVDIRSEAEEEQFDPETETSEEDSEHEEEMINTYPIRVALTVTKTDASGALSLDMMCQEGQFILDNISFYRDGKLATESSAEADWKRRGVYMGPQFDTLDVGLQEEFDKFLQERGIDESLAMFIPEYAEHKEQGEYVHWLRNVKQFVDV